MRITVEQLIKSDTAIRLGINNTPGEEELANLKNLMSAILNSLS